MRTHSLLSALILLGLGLGLGLAPTLGTAAAPAPSPHAAANALPIPTLTPAPPPDSGMRGAVFYDLLYAEMLAAHGQLAPAAHIMLQLAEHEHQRPELYRRAAQMAAGLGDIKLGLEVAQAWHKAMPQSAEALRNTLQMQILAQQPDAALQSVKTLLQITPKADIQATLQALPEYFALQRSHKTGTGTNKGANTGANTGAGETAGISPSQQSALENLLLPYTTQPEYAASAWVSVARLRAQAGQAAPAQQAALEALKLEPSNENAALVLLNELFQAQKPADTPSNTRAPTPTAPTASTANASAFNPSQIQATQAALAHFVASQHASVRFRIAYSAYLMSAQQNAAALQQLQSLAKERPLSARIALMQGLVQMEGKNPSSQETAAQTLQHALQLLPNDPEEGENAALQDEIVFALADLAQDQKNYAQAEHWLEQASDPLSLTVQLRRAWLTGKQGHWQQALKLVQALPEQGAITARVKLFMQVQILTDAQQYPAAYALLTPYVEKNPKDFDATNDLALLADRTGHYAQMEQLLQQAMKQRPTDPQAYNSLGYSLADRNERLPEAKALIEKALSLSPGNPMMTDSLGWVEYRMGNLPAAQAHLQDAYSKLPDVEIAAHLGEVLWMQGDKAAARKVWQGAARTAPQNETLQKTMARFQVSLPTKNQGH